MTLPTALLEPSFLDLVAAIERATELSEQRRRHWVCSLRQIAKWLDRPATVIPARWSSVRFPVGQLHHARVGVTAKTLANHKSNARAALRWFGKEQDVPQGIRLSAEWATFRDRIDNRIRNRLYNLIRYCSARGVAPSAVDDKIFDEYWCYRTETTALLLLLAADDTEKTDRRKLNERPLPGASRDPRILIRGRLCSEDTRRTSKNVPPRLHDTRQENPGVDPVAQHNDRNGRRITAREAHCPTEPLDTVRGGR